WRLVVPRDDVIFGEAVALDTKDLLAAGQDRLARRQLHTSTAGVLHELVHDVEARRIRRDAHFRANAEAVDRGPGGHERRDGAFVEAAAHENADRVEAGLVEKATGTVRQIEQVARIETHRRDAEITTELLRQLDHLADPCQVVVRV